MCSLTYCWKEGVGLLAISVGSVAVELHLPNLQWVETDEYNACFYLKGRINLHGSSLSLCMLHRSCCARWREPLGRWTVEARPCPTSFRPLREGSSHLLNVICAKNLYCLRERNIGWNGRIKCALYAEGGGTGEDFINDHPSGHLQKSSFWHEIQNFHLPIGQCGQVQ